MAAPFAASCPKNAASMEAAACSAGEPVVATATRRILPSHVEAGASATPPPPPCSHQPWMSAFVHPTVSSTIKLMPPHIPHAAADLARSEEHSDPSFAAHNSDELAAGDSGVTRNVSRMSK